MADRRKKKQIKVGDVKIGGSAPISIQSMVKVATSDVSAVVAQIRKLEKAGCEIVRVAVKNMDDAAAVRKIKNKIKIPLVCDIHFDYRLALESIKNGADKIRLNPGNITNPSEIEAVASAAKKARLPIRIGVNSGSVGGLTPRGSDPLCSSALAYIKLFERFDFHDIIVSLKASDVAATAKAYRKFSAVSDYPLHLGVTASGSYDNGVVKSAIGIGALLLDGIGDTIRVSLTADPVEEVLAARRILSAVGSRRFGPEVISCPTCGRCQVDLGAVVKEFERKLSAIRSTRYAIRKTPLSIAIMGCEVNGPGEAKEADIGIAFGKGFGVLFRNGKVVKRVGVKDAVKELFNAIR